MEGQIAAIVTGPISKEAVNLAGHAYAGHTDMLADLTGSSDTCMMLAHENLRVSHVSTHVALARVPSLVTPARLAKVIDLTLSALSAFGFEQSADRRRRPQPACRRGRPLRAGGHRGDAARGRQLQGAGVAVSGPISGDTIFVRALSGEFDAVIAMYHDQGHIPIKLLGFKVDPASRKWTSLSGVNITLGLPFIRTSVDHGTAFDIAGKGIASAQSMVEAIDLAVKLAPSVKAGAPRVAAAPTRWRTSPWPRKTDPPRRRRVLRRKGSPHFASDIFRAAGSDADEARSSPTIWSKPISSGTIPTASCASKNM